MTEMQHGSQMVRKRWEMDLCLFSNLTQNDNLLQNCSTISFNYFYDDLQLEIRSLQALLMQEYAITKCIGHTVLLYLLCTTEGHPPSACGEISLSAAINGR